MRSLDLRHARGDGVTACGPAGRDAAQRGTHRASKDNGRRAAELLEQRQQRQRLFFRGRNDTPLAQLLRQLISARPDSGSSNVVQLTSVHTGARYRHRTHR